MTIEIDGKPYTVGVFNLKRDFEIKEKYNVTTEDGVRHRELVGIYKNYTLLLGNVSEDTYDALLSVFISNKEYQRVKLPDGKNGFITFNAMFKNIFDELMTKRNGIRFWNNITVRFEATEPIGGV